MSQPSEIERRLTAVEARVEEVAADAAAARHLAAARDRDLADFAIKIDANRVAINALGVQTAARFDRLEGRVDRLEEKVDRGFAAVDRRFAKLEGEMRNGFATVRAQLDQTAGGMQRIVDLLERRDGGGS